MQVSNLISSLITYYLQSLFLDISAYITNQEKNVESGKQKVKDYFTPQTFSWKLSNPNNPLLPVSPKKFQARLRIQGYVDLNWCIEHDNTDTELIFP